MLIGGVLPSLTYIKTLSVFWVLSQSALNITIALCIERCVRCSTDSFGILMNWPPVVYVGTISYSLYLWQELFFTRYKVTPLTTFPLNILAVVLCAVLSYHFVELQFLRLKRQFEV